MSNHFELDRDQKRHLRFEALRGLGDGRPTARLCGMNLYLHGIGDAADATQPDPDRRRAPDEPGAHADVVVTNPPFGKKSSITIVNEEGEPTARTSPIVRHDFWTTTNKQLNFVQHVKSLLRSTAAPPSSCRTTSSSRAAPARPCAGTCSQECEVHTLLRLPTGIFYAQGVKANVLFFDRKPARRRPVDEDALGLRPPHQQALHAQDQAALRAGRPRRLRRLLPPRRPAERVGGRAASSRSPTTSSLRAIRQTFRSLAGWRCLSWRPVGLRGGCGFCWPAERVVLLAEGRL